MANKVVVHSNNAAGERFEISLEQIRPDKGLIRVKSWNNGQDIATAPPSKDDIVKLYDIRSRSSMQISCKGDVFGPDPIIICSLTEARGSAGRPLVEIEVSGSLFGTFDGTTTYPVPPDDFKNLKKFLTDADFPQ